MFMHTINKYILFCFSWILLVACEAGGVVEPPASPQAKAIARNQAVDLSWPAVEGAVVYHVYYSTSSVDIQRDATVLTTATPDITIGNLKNDTVYYFSVTAIGAGGESFGTQLIESIPRNPPDPPQEVEISAGNESINISWKNVPEANSYNIYLARSSGINTDNIKSLSGWIVIPNAVSPHTQTGLVNGTSYYAVVTAISDSGESSVSAEHNAIPTSTLTLAVGNEHACAVLIDNTLWCWGLNESGQVGDKSYIQRSVPALAGSQIKWKSVSAGTRHTCGISVSDTLWCWGRDVFAVDSGYLLKNNEPVQFEEALKWNAVIAGQDNVCAFSQEDSSKITCWGDKSNILENSALQNFYPLYTRNQLMGNVFANGIDYSCAIDVSGDIHCWKSTVNERYGISFPLDLSDVIDSSSSPLKWQSIAVSRGSSKGVSDGNICAISSDASLWCRDGNNYEQTAANKLMLTQFSPDRKWQMVALGSNHGCGIQNDNSLWCWGSNEYGQLGLTSSQHTTLPTQINQETNWSFVSAYGNNSCASKLDGTVWCTGRNNYGQLGNGSSAFVQDPVRVLSGVVKFAASDYALCTLNSDSKTYCWGNNGNSNLGMGHHYTLQSPTAVVTEGQFIEIAIDVYKSCGITHEGQLKCSGFIDSNHKSNIPVDLLTSFVEWKSVGVGSGINLCAIKRDNSIWCVDKTLKPQGEDPALKLVDDSSDWKSLVATDEFACAIDIQDQLGCWGAINWNEKLGIGEYDLYETVQIVMPGKKWFKVAIDSLHVCAIDDGKKLWCWGNNEYGQFGNGSKQKKSSGPLAVLENNNWQDIAVNEYRTCGVKEDGSLWCWGLPMPDVYGKVDSSQAMVAPLQVGRETDWEDVEIGAGFICAIKANKELYCWGVNNLGQIGNGLSWRSAWEQVKFEDSSIALQ